MLYQCNGSLTLYFDVLFIVFQPFIGDITADVHVCAGRNVHHRKLDEIQKIHTRWEVTPPTMNKIDLRQIIQDSSIQEVGKLRYVREKIHAIRLQ